MTRWRLWCGWRVPRRRTQSWRPDNQRNQRGQICTMILLRNIGGECPFQDLLNQDYRLVYQDTNNVCACQYRKEADTPPRELIP
jgi:hypothetical protein